MATKRYSQTHHRAGYDAGRAVYLGQEKLANAKRRLAREHGFNESSAQDYIIAYEFLVRGVVFKRTLSVEAFDSYLTWLRSDEGDGALRTALQGLTLHEDYYEGVSSGRPSIRAVIDRDTQLLGALLSMSKLQQEFEQQVRRSAADSASARRARLAARPDAAPARATVTATAYLRDPDVVAEVLARANGHCERCRNPAPFLTRTGEPYLEVHHVVWLARGGKDTVENARALCPNCHRELHYGAAAGGESGAG